MTSAHETAAAIIARRVPGPFRDEGGLPGEWQSMRTDTAARAYLWNRRVRGMGATAAMREAAPVALLPHTVRRPQGYGNRGGAGARFTEGGDVLRWIESTEAAGLRFVAWADDVGGAGVRHTGWHCDDEGRETLRGGVWQLPGKGKAARLVYGYAEHEGGREMNPGSAALCVSDIVQAPMAGDTRGDLLEADETADAARWADGLAESTADDRRDYDSAYQAGRAAAELDAEAIEAAETARPLLAEMKAARGNPFATPAICAALAVRLADLRETISDKRRERDSAWGDCPTSAESAWAAGFMEEAADGFRRAVRLGYASRGDWRGAPEANPCGPVPA